MIIKLLLLKTIGTRRTSLKLSTVKLKFSDEIVEEVGFASYECCLVMLGAQTIRILNMKL